MGLVAHSGMSALDLLRAYEQRPITLGQDEIRRRKHGTALGQELNRLQGIESTPLSDRLANIWAYGQASRNEYNTLCRLLIMEKMQTDKPLSSHDR